MRNENPVQIPDTIPADAHDRCNYVAKYHMANFQIQAIMKLDGRLDFDMLVEAVRLSIDSEPVLGCRFIKLDSPYWKPIDNIDNINLCSIEETDNPDKAIQRFLESPLDMDKDPVVKVRLIRSANYDTLGLKINHACCDAAGAREYILLLADIYSRISAGENDFAPEPSIRSRKDHEKLLSALSEENSGKPWSTRKQISFPTWNFPWRNMKIGRTHFVFSRLPYGHLDVMKSYGKARNATVNDLILTAVYRAMFALSKPPYGSPMDIPVTIDLRKYLPDNKAEAIRNLSGGIVMRLARKANEPFEDTLSRVMSLTKIMRDGHPSKENLLMAEKIEKMNFYQICAYLKTASQFIDMLSLNPFYIVNKCSPGMRRKKSRRGRRAFGGAAGKLPKAAEGNGI